MEEPIERISDHKINIELLGAQSYFEPLIKPSPISPELKKATENFIKAAERFSSHLIEKGVHYTIRGRIQDGKIFIEEENREETTARDNEYILFDSKKINL